MIVLQGPLGHQANCEACSELIEPDEIACTWEGNPYCSLACIEQSLGVQDADEGADFTASQDQALATVTEILAKRPQRFVFVYQPLEPGEGDIGVTIFAPTEFVFSTVEALARALTEAEYTYVAPPPEG